MDTASVPNLCSRPRSMETNTFEAPHKCYGPNQLHMPSSQLKNSHNIDSILPVCTNIPHSLSRDASLHHSEYSDLAPMPSNSVNDTKASVVDLCTTHHHTSLNTSQSSSTGISLVLEEQLEKDIELEFIKTVSKSPALPNNAPSYDHIDPPCSIYLQYLLANTPSTLV